VRIWRKLQISIHLSGASMKSIKNLNTDLFEKLKSEFYDWYDVLSDDELETNSDLIRVIERVDRLFDELASDESS